MALSLKKTKLIIFLLAILLMVAFAGLVDKDESSPEELSPATVYYVPVTNYFSSLEDVSEEWLLSNPVYLQNSDRDTLSGLITSAEVREYNESQKLGLNEVAIVRWDRVTPDLKSLSYRGSYLWDENQLANYQLKAETRIPSTAEELIFDSSKITKINFLGDIMLSRHVNTQMERYGYDYPWEKVASVVADADITFANLEVPISDRYEPPAAGMSFVASTKNLDQIKAAGIDIVSVANNHTANFGRQAFLDNLQNLSGSGIKVCGGGLSEAEARKAATVENRGVLFSFLCQSAVVGSLFADDNSAGVPYLGIEPWYRRNENSIADLIQNIKAIREGVVIDSPHWGVEYKQYPNTDQREVARRMVDAGADLIIGTHPHIVQSSEYYKDKYISYSLGNFIFDQEWSTETKQGVMASAYFYGEKNLAVQLVPLQIENYAQPRFVTDDTKSKILRDIEKHSVGF